MIFVTSGMLAQTAQQKTTILLNIQKPLNPLPLTFLFRKIPLDVPVSKSVLSPDYYASQLSFFCKQEIKFEKIAKIPLKFRLGSVEDCDRMEGKRKFH